MIAIDACIGRILIAYFLFLFYIATNAISFLGCIYDPIILKKFLLVYMVTSLPTYILFGSKIIWSYCDLIWSHGNLLTAKVHYGTSLSNVDWLHGGAESLLTLTNLFVVLGLREALRKIKEAKKSTPPVVSEVKEKSSV